MKDNRGFIVHEQDSTGSIAAARGNWRRRFVTSVFARRTDPSSAGAEAAAIPAGARRSIAWAWVCWFATGVVVIALLAPLLNRYWVPVSDSDAYLAIARSIALGEGFRYNNNPVAVVPPGWPVILAGAMRLTSSFFFLKLCLVAGLVAFLAAAWWFVRWYAPTWQACVIIILTALTYETSRHVYTFHSEPAFCAVLGLALLLATWIRKSGSDAGESRRWAAAVEIMLLIVLCAGLVWIRWAGVLVWPLVAAALLEGELRPRLNRRWAAAVISGMAALVTFIVLQQMLKVDPKELDHRFAHNLVKLDRRAPVSLAGRLGRLGHCEQWLVNMYWPAIPALYPGSTARVIGWAGLGLIAAAALADGRRRRWIAAAALGYVLMLTLLWPRPVGRYVVPAAPLLLVAMFRGAAVLFASVGPARLVHAAAAGAIVLSVLRGSVPGYLRQVKEQQADDFYAVYKRGVYDGLIDVAKRLDRMGAKPGQVAISRRFIYPSGPKDSNAFVRGLILLSDLPVRTLPASMNERPTVRLREWAAKAKVRYCVYHLPARPPRTQTAAATQESRAVPEVSRSRARPKWRIWVVSGGRPRLVLPASTANWPRHVPGLWHAQRPPAKQAETSGSR